MIEYKKIDKSLIDNEYERVYGRNNYQNRNDYKFAIKICNDFPNFKFSKDFPEFVITWNFEFIYEIMAGYDLIKAIKEEDKYFLKFIDLIEQMVEEDDDNYEDIFAVLECTYKAEELQKILKYFKPLTISAYNDYIKRTRI